MLSDKSMDSFKAAQRGLFMPAHSHKLDQSSLLQL